MASLKTSRIVDNLAGASRGAVEVTATMDDGASRWCFFMTPPALAVAGGLGSRHPGEGPLRSPGGHLIVVSELNADTVARIGTPERRVDFVHSRNGRNRITWCCSGRSSFLASLGRMLAAERQYR